MRGSTTRVLSPWRVWRRFGSSWPSSPKKTKKTPTTRRWTRRRVCIGRCALSARTLSAFSSVAARTRTRSVPAAACSARARFAPGSSLGSGRAWRRRSPRRGRPAPRGGGKKTAGADSGRGVDVAHRARRRSRRRGRARRPARRVLPRPRALAPGAERRGVLRGGRKGGGGEKEIGGGYARSGRTPRDRGVREHPGRPGSTSGVRRGTPRKEGFVVRRGGCWGRGIFFEARRLERRRAKR